MQRQAPHQTTAKWRSAVDPQSRVPLASGPFSPRAVRLAALDSCWIQPPGSQAGAHGREMVAKPGGCGALGARAVLEPRVTATRPRAGEPAWVASQEQPCSLDSG